MNIQINADRLFLASRIALVATAMTFVIRAGILAPVGTELGLSAKEMGIVSGTAFWGFTISMMIGGFFCDIVGMKKLIFIAFAGHLAGIALTIAATDFWSLFISTLLVGIANGMVEAACNPLVASLYTEEKTKKLNQFHVWFPGGIVIGGLTAYFLEKMNANWQWQTATILLPTLVYGGMFLRLKFPVTERVSSGVSTKEMMINCLNPLFIFMVICMLFTAATELGTNQWIVELLLNVGVPSILLLVFISGIMAMGRAFAGQIEHLLAPAGMLLYSAIFSALGLVMLANTSGYMSFAAAAVFAAGICYFWPTMLGFVSEYLPKTGALGLSVMGGAGMLSVSIILPFMGAYYENTKKLLLGTASTPEAEKAAQLAAGADTLEYVALLPAVLTVAFLFLYIYTKSVAPYKKVLN